jgi:hypothetical protein
VSAGMLNPRVLREIREEISFALQIIFENIFFSEVFTKEDNEVIEDIKPHISINPMEEFIFNELEIISPWRITS